MLIGIPVYDDVDMLDVTGPFEMFTWAGLDIEIVAHACGRKGIQLGEIDDRRQNPDRRGSSRRKILKPGITFWPNGDSSECIVCNLSETGAQLELRGPAPNLFDLIVEGDRWRRSCSVVWRKANRVGVKFQEQSRLTSSARKQAADFRRYAEECRMLAGTARPSDRESLLEMAEEWITVIRRLQRKVR